MQSGTEAGQGRKLARSVVPAADPYPVAGVLLPMVEGVEPEVAGVCEDDLMPSPTRAEQRERDRIARRLSQAGFALPGTLLERYKACGKPGCRCHADPPQLHGPYQQWTRKISGKTVTRRLTDQQARDYGPWFDQARQLRDLITQLETLSLHIYERDHTPP